MSTPAIRRTLSGIGAVYEGESPEVRRLRGSCFSVVDPCVFVTAAHNISQLPIEHIWLNHFGGPPPQCITRAREVHVVGEGDIAVITTDAPEARWAYPFQAVQYAVDFGEEVYAIGFPGGTMTTITPNRETLRYFRGIVQRPFLYEVLGERYSAYELSFPCPMGLSGGPVLLARDPRIVLGVVTRNWKTYTEEEEEEDRIITYGVASNIIYAADVLKKVLGRDVPNR